MKENKIAEIIEQIRCSQINFDNLVEMNPVIANHPMYKIARMQLDYALKIAEGNEDNYK